MSRTKCVYTYVEICRAASLASPRCGQWARDELTKAIHSPLGKLKPICML